MRAPILPLLAPPLAVLALAGPAAAQTAASATTVQTTFRGAAPAGCQMGAPASPTLSNAEITSQSPGSADIAILQLVGEDGAPQAATIALSLPAFCNQAHRLTLTSQSGGLVADGPPLTGGPFRAELAYTVVVSWAGLSQAYQTSGGATQLVVPDAATGSVAITIQIPGGGQPLAAGVYSDQLILELGVAG